MQMKKSKSYYYWKAREQAQDQIYKDEEERYLQYINKQYDLAMDQIQKEIDSFYAKYATSEGISIAEAKRRVSKLDIEEYSRKAEKYVRNKTFTKKANEEMRLYNATMKINRLEMLKANIGLETVSAQSDVEKYLDEILEGRTREEIKHQSGVLGESVNTNTDKAIAAIVNGSFRNSKYTAKWSDTLWKNQTLLKSELDRLLTKGLTQGKSSRALASELRKSINAEKSVAERLMRTELARVSIESGLSLMEENEYDEYMYMTLSFKDGKICDDCKALDGKHFKRKDAEVGFNLPPMHPNCRCSIAPYEDDDNFESSSGTINLAKNPARIQSMDYKQLLPRTDITHEEVKGELKKSAVGRETLKIINKSDNLRLSYIQGWSQPDRRRGEQEGNIINVYLDCTRNVRITAETVIHEVTHYYYGIERCQWAEAVCFAREKMHIVNRKLTYAEKREIIKLVKDNYPNFNWKKGGRRNGKKI